MAVGQSGVGGEIFLLLAARRNSFLKSPLFSSAAKP